MCRPSIVAVCFVLIFFFVVVVVVMRDVFNNTPNKLINYWLHAYTHTERDSRTFIDNWLISTGVIRLSADNRCNLSLACCSTAMRNASWTVLHNSPAKMNKCKKIFSWVTHTYVMKLSTIKSIMKNLWDEWIWIFL
mgnify:CR=1 FL=1